MELRKERVELRKIDFEFEPMDSEDEKVMKS